MSGWISLALIGLLAAFGLWCAGVARPLRGLVGAAVLLGASGYALQQHASLTGHPAVAGREAVVIDPASTALRAAMLGQFTGDGAFLVASDALMRSGSRASGTKVVLLGLNSYPRSLTLWTGAGTALAQHDGAVSPAASFAFDQATRLAPEHPAPPYFRGLAYAETGDFVKARRYWARALALSPREAGYRRDIAEQLATLDAVRAE